MKKRLLNLFLILLIGFNFLFFNSNLNNFVYAACDIKNYSSPEEYQQAIDECQKEIDSRMGAQNKNKEDLARLEKNIQNIQKVIKFAVAQIDNLEKEIFDREVKLAYQQEILAARVRSFYKKSRQYSPILILLASSSANDLFRELSYRQTATEQDKKMITEISQDLITLKTDKEKLEKNKNILASAQKKLDQQAGVLKVDIGKVEDYFTEISSKIAELSTRQQEIINARSGSFIASIGDIELADDYNASIKGFRESAPSGYFAVFSFGAFTHRKGMSQYGARGRAQSGQNYKAILKAYYGKEPVGKDTGGDIIVNGAVMNFEDKYLMGIAEMPSSWNMEALKAQAVAARTYAYRYKTQGKSICTTEKCQVFNSGKAANPPEAWRQAVQSTRGEVLEDVVTYYASTHGGYANPIGWDTTNGSGGGNFIDNTYDKIGGSPWLYKAWYTQGYSVNSDKCGRSNPWLTSEEMADIINAAIYRDERVTPITTSCWGGNPYSHTELREKANGYSSVYSVSVTQGNGLTSEVIFQTDKGEVRLSGPDFKTAFNLRAPGYLAIPQRSFAFYNIEKK